MSKRVSIITPGDVEADDVENVILVPDDWTDEDIDQWGGVPKGRSARIWAQNEIVHGPGDFIDKKTNPGKPVRRPEPRGQEIITARQDR